MSKQSSIEIGVLLNEALVALGGGEAEHFELAPHLAQIQVFSGTSQQLLKRRMSFGQRIQRRPFHLEYLTGNQRLDRDLSRCR